MTTISTQQVLSQAIVSAMTVSIMANIMATAAGVVTGAAGKISQWRRVAVVPAEVAMAILYAGASVFTLGAVIPKHVEFNDVKIIDAYSKRPPSTVFMQSTRHTMIIQLPGGETAELPSNVDASKMVGETIRVKVIEGYFGKYDIYISD